MSALDERRSCENNERGRATGRYCGPEPDHVFLAPGTRWCGSRNLPAWGRRLRSLVRAQARPVLTLPALVLALLAFRLERARVAHLLLRSARATAHPLENASPGAQPRWRTPRWPVYSRPHPMGAAAGERALH